MTLPLFHLPPILSPACQDTLLSPDHGTILISQSGNTCCPFVGHPYRPLSGHILSPVHGTTLRLVQWGRLLPLVGQRISSPPLDSSHYLSRTWCILLAAQRSSPLWPPVTVSDKATALDRQPTRADLTSGLFKPHPRTCAKGVSRG
jgi:hypothetical protein